jgi:hypothetical protein
MIFWNIFEISSKQDVLHGVSLRGRIRKFSIENNIICLVENASDKENLVRFAVPDDLDPIKIFEFVKNILPDSDIIEVQKSIQNPVLSKLKINDLSRYTI